MAAPTKRKLNTGFTLVEMAVVVTIMAILMTLGLAAATSVMQSTQRSTTKEREAFLKDALAAYFFANKRFPCPDNGSNVGNTGRDGVEDRVVGGAVPDPNTNCSTQLGTIPYVTLGISRSQALDAYGNFITYRLDATNGWHRTATACPTPPAAGVLVSNNIGPTAPAILVLISHGPNGLGAWNTGATNTSRNVLPTPPELANTQLNLAAPYNDFEYSDVAANPFDDLFDALRLGDLSVVAIKLSKPICS